MKYSFLLLLLFELSSCQHQQSSPSTLQPPPPVATEYSYPVLQQLITQYQQAPQARLLTTLDSICCHADGALSEECASATIALFEHQSQEVSAYLFAHPHSGVEQALIDGYSEKYAVYEPVARTKQLLALQQAWQANAQQLPAQQAAYMREVFARIKPSKFD